MLDVPQDPDLEIRQVPQPVRSQYNESHEAGLVTCVPHNAIAKSRFFEFSAVDLAAVCTAYDDLGHLFPYQEMLEALWIFLRSASHSQTLLAKKAIVEASIELSEAWTDQLLRTAAALGSYVFAVVLAYYRTIHPDTQPEIYSTNLRNIPSEEGYVWIPPWVDMGVHRVPPQAEAGFNNRTSHSIAFAISYSWLISAVILSAAAGGFSNQHSVETILDRLKRKVPELGLPTWELGTTKSGIEAGATGMNYGYRPTASAIAKHEPGIGPQEEQDSKGGQPTCSLAQLDRKPPRRTWVAIIPLVASTLCGFLISWFTPTQGLGCRSLHQASLLFLFILSHGGTFLMQRFLIHGQARTYQYPCIIIKDALVAVTHLTMLCLAFSGFYNRCFCWAAWFSRGPQKAAVTIFIEEYFKVKLRTVWPALIFSALTVQFMFSAAVILGKPRCRIFKKTTEEQQESAEKLRVYEGQLPGGCSVCNK